MAGITRQSRKALPLSRSTSPLTKAEDDNSVGGNANDKLGNNNANPPAPAASVIMSA